MFLDRTWSTKDREGSNLKKQVLSRQRLVRCLGRHKKLLGPLAKCQGGQNQTMMSQLQTDHQASPHSWGPQRERPANFPSLPGVGTRLLPLLGRKEPGESLPVLAHHILSTKEGKQGCFFCIKTEMSSGDGVTEIGEVERYHQDTEDLLGTAKVSCPLKKTLL